MRATIINEMDAWEGDPAEETPPWPEGFPWSVNLEGRGCVAFCQEESDARALARGLARKAKRRPAKIHAVRGAMTAPDGGTAYLTPCGRVARRVQVAEYARLVTCRKCGGV